LSIIRIGWAAVAILAAGCTGPADELLVAKYRQIELTAMSDVAIDHPLDFREFIRLATNRSPDALLLELSEMDAFLSEEQEKAQRFPALSVAPGYLVSPFQARAGSIEGFGFPLVFQWDVMQLVSASEIDAAFAQRRRAEDIQRSLRVRQIKSEIIAALYLREEIRLNLESAGIQSDLASCGKRTAGAELSLGTISRRQAEDAALASSLALQSLDLQREASAAYDRRLARLAGLSSPPAFAAAPAPLREPVGRDITLTSCRSATGIVEMADILAQAAEKRLRLAETERWRNIDVDLSFFDLSSPDRQISASMSWLIPLIDQGAATRRVVQERTNILRLLLTQRKMELEFEEALQALLLSEIEGLQSLRSTELALSGAPSGLETDITGVCGTRERQEQLLSLDNRRAQLEVAKRQALLVAFCGVEAPEQSGAR
jgi:hypothetical protein